LPILKGDSSEAALKAALLRSEAAETSLRRERDMQDTVAAMARIGGWELDLATLTPLWSDEVYRIHGMDPASRPSLRDALKYYAPEARPGIEQAVRDALEHGTPYDLIVPLVTGEDKPRWARIMGVAEMRNGVVTRLYGAMQDVTSQREAENARLAGLAAEAAASRAKADFLANMSHEIRTPMNGVLGMTELLLDTALQPTQREFAQTIRNSATSLLTIVNDILDFSKMESGKLEIERVDMSVRECVEDVGMALAAQANGRGVEIIVNVDPAVPERMLGDAVRLRQVLINLAGNALKFTPSGEVAIEVFPIALQAGRVLLSFEVRDSGIGMEPETIKQLFEPFIQGDASSTRQHGGTGLGLTLVRGLVSLMDGNLDVSSSPGRGSVFTFTLPFEAIYDAADPAGAVHASHHGKRVLVMDDNSTNRRVLRGQLQPAGLEVKEAATGADTLKSMHDAQQSGQPFDVVIVDDQMPDCDGFSFASQVKATPGIAASQLILLTSLERHDTVKSLANAGFAGYLTKPVRGRELRACIERVLEREQGGSSGRFQGLVTRSSLTAEQGQGRYLGRVLVVEDNIVNQQVAKRFIERLGCEVTLVGNGERAVEACRSTEFGLVLMDVQMPVMDGLAATREIRSREATGRRVPIIALTASAMTDEVARCMAAGMDAVLAKPLEIGKLRELLEQHGFRAEGSGGPPVPAAAPAAPVSNPVDLDQLRGVVGDDAEFLRELCDTFVSSSTAIVSELAQALGAADRPALSSLAHKLKGGSSSVCAHELAKLAAALEKDAKEKPMPELAESVADLKRAFTAAASYVAAQIGAV
jgi:signal transduction histidine kinase/CheY-like chemotaxis protein